jgi:TolA-binding protein
MDITRNSHEGVLLSQRSHHTHGWKRVRARAGALLAVALIALTSGGCVYFNTFYHAKKFYRDGERVRDQAGLHAGASAGKTLYESAIEKASKIVEKHPGSKYHDDALFMIGMCYFRTENFTKSENAFRELLATHPDSKFDEEARLYLARCRMELGDEQAGFRTFTELAETARKSEWRSEAIYQRGAFFFENESYDSATIEFERVLREFPKSDRAIDARLSAADALRHLGRYAEAIELYRPITKDDEYTDVHFEALDGIGKTFYESGQPDSGIAIYWAMADDVRFEDTLGAVRLALGRGLEDIKDYDEAWRQYEKVAAAYEKTPFSAEAYFRMGEIKQYVEEDLVAAKEMYDQSRLEHAAGQLSQVALARSANITKLEQFRKDLGRGELTRGGRGTGGDEGPYDRALMPRLEREINYSPLAARPPDYVSPLADLDSTLAELGPPTPDDLALADTLAAPQDSTTAVVAEIYGPPTDLAPFLGPPTDSAAIVFNMTRDILLPASYWHSYVGSDSAYGPVSPAYLYEFGEGDLYGPSTPADTLLHQWAVAEIDTAAERMKAERETARAERKAEMEAIRTSAITQLQLAELYRFSLSAPDSAVVEYDNMVRRYPTSPYAPKALLGAADVLMDDLGDTLAAYDRLRAILQQYPYSDFAGEAIARLHLGGTEADTAYPELLYREAENTYLAGGDPKRAIEELETFIDRYPESHLVPNAEFTIATLREQNFPTEDSSVILAYQEIETNYPQSPFADAVSAKLAYRVDRPQRRKRTAVPTEGELADSSKGGGHVKDTTQIGAGLPVAPRPVAAPNFVYPESEIGTYEKEMRNVYKIWIDFTGVVTEAVPLQVSPSAAINESALQAMMGTRFNPDSIPIDSLNMYYRFELKIVPPAKARDEFDDLFPDMNRDPQKQNKP